MFRGRKLFRSDVNKCVGVSVPRAKYLTRMEATDSIKHTSKLR